MKSSARESMKLEIYLHTSMEQKAVVNLIMGCSLRLHIFWSLGVENVVDGVSERGQDTFYETLCA